MLNLYKFNKERLKNREAVTYTQLLLLLLLLLSRFSRIRLCATP